MFVLDNFPSFTAKPWHNQLFQNDKKKCKMPDLIGKMEDQDASWKVKRKKKQEAKWVGKMDRPA